MNDHFAVYYVNNAFHSIDDAMDMRIMEVLSEGDMTITEVASALSKSPSTVTTHLRDLKREGLLTSRTSETDSRATVYSAGDSEMVAVSDPDRVADDVFDGIVEMVVSDDMPLMEGIFKMFICGMESISMDVIPSVDILAHRMGSIIASRTSGDDIYTLLTAIKDFISDSGIGEMTFALSDCVTVHIMNPRMRNDLDSHLTREFCASLIGAALERGLGKEIRGETTDGEKDLLTLRFFFREQ